MNGKKDMQPKNDKGKPHGYWEIYWHDNTLACKGEFSNNLKIGLWEFDDGWDVIDIGVRVVYFIQ